MLNVQHLVKQCEYAKIEFTDQFPNDLGAFSFIVDAIFGYSYKPPIRAPFDYIIQVWKPETTVFYNNL